MNKHEPVIEADDSRDATLSDRIKDTSSELLALASRFNTAAVKMETARVAQSLPGIRSAYLDLHEIISQSAFLADGVQHAIEKEHQRLAI